MPAFLPGDLRKKPISMILVSSCETTPRRYHHSYEPLVPLIRIVSSLTQTEMLLARDFLFRTEALRGTIQMSIS